MLGAGALCLLGLLLPSAQGAAHRIDLAAASRRLLAAPQGLNVHLVEASGSRLPAGFSHYPDGSTFACTGLKWGEHNRYGQPLARSCRFDNVCLNHTSLEWQYYLPPGPEPLFYRQQDGQPQWEFPSDFVNTGHVHIKDISDLDWAPTVVRAPFPSSILFHAAPVVAYHSLNDFLANFGHTLYDFLFPVFNMLQLLGLYTPDFQLVFARLQGDNDQIAGAFLTNERPERNLGPLVSRHPPLTKAQLAAGSRGQLTCVHTLVAGAGSLQATMARTRVAPFRAASFVNMGIPTEVDLGAQAPQVTILKKKGRRIIENSDEISARLKASLPGCRVVVVEGEQIATMSIRDQLDLMSRTSVLITPSGGLGTVAMFLQPGATAIVFNFWADTRSTSEQQENIMSWNIEYVDFEYFPIIAEDYEGTSDRPGCETREDSPHYAEQGRLLHCNTRLRNLTRLDHVVQGALRKWAVNHDKPVPQWVSQDATATGGGGAAAGTGSNGGSLAGLASSLSATLTGSSGAAAGGSTTAAGSSKAAAEGAAAGSGSGVAASGSGGSGSGSASTGSSAGSAAGGGAAQQRATGSRTGQPLEQLSQQQQRRTLRKESRLRRAHASGQILS